MTGADARAQTPPSSAGDAVPEGAAIIEIRVGELRQLFNAIDPSPFRERDLEPRAEEFIVGWASDLPPAAPLALVVHLGRTAGRPDEADMLREAIHGFFAGRVVASRRQLRDLLSRGRVSLVIALVFLAATILAGDALAAYATGNRLAAVLREGLVIGGWVAMWRPLEVFLYDWWPIRGERRMLERLSRMPVSIRYAAVPPSDAWRADWPAVVADRVAPRGAQEPSAAFDRASR